MSTKNRKARHNLYWQARSAHDPIEVIGFIGDVEYAYNPQARDAQGPFLYDPYSQPAYLPAQQDADETADGFNQQLFQSMAFDAAQAALDFRTRDFSPALQRWTQSESAGYSDGPNAYMLVNGPTGNPVNPLDLTIQATETC